MKMIRTQNTGNLVKLDDVDWEVAKHVQWFEYGAKVMNPSGVELDAYCQMPGTRKQYAERLNYMRSQYDE